MTDRAVVRAGSLQKGLLAMAADAAQPFVSTGKWKAAGGLVVEYGRTPGAGVVAPGTLFSE